MRLSFATLREDFLASIVVFLVALPLCMGISIASGVPPALGLITGIVGGLLVGLLAGAPLQVSGPAAGLAVIVYQIVEDYGLAALGVVVLLGGAIQSIAGLLRLGQWFRAVSPAVIKGMLGGIGALILASQFHVMVDDKPPGGGIQNLITIPQAIYKGVVPSDDTVHHLAALIGLTTIAVIILWSLFGTKRLPAPLVAVVAATAVAIGFDLSIRRVDVPSNLLDSVRWPSLEVISGMGIATWLTEGLAVAFIASAETLLCATAVDQMHSGPRTRYNHELFAQGVGNMVCGAFGALPMTGVIVRSSANVQAGAKTRASAILHGVWLLALVVAAPQLLMLIPTASLAAILVYTGYKLINPAGVRQLIAGPKTELATYVVTFGGVVAIDLLSGVLLGLALAAALLLVRLSRLEIDLSFDGQQRHDVVLRGAATFVGLPKLARQLESLPEGREVHLHVRDLRHADLACIELITSFRERYESHGGNVIVEWDELLQRYRPSPKSA